MDNDFWGFAAGVALIFGSSALIVTTGYVGSNYYTAGVLRGAGYEVKLVNGTCLAKYSKRWVSCDAVLGNQVEIVQDKKTLAD